MRNQRVKQDDSVFYIKLRPIMIGVSAGAIVCAVLLALFAVLISSNDIPQVAINPMAIAASVLGALAAGFVTARLCKGRGMMYGAAAGLTLFTIILLISVLACQPTFGLVMLLRLIMLPIAGAIGGVAGMNVKGKRH